MHPAGDRKECKELRRGRRVSARLTVGKQEAVAHGLNFRIREDPPATIEVRVVFSRVSGILVWYEHRGQLNGACIPRLEEVAPWQSHEEVGGVRIIGGFCRRRSDVEGLEFEPQESPQGVKETWRRHQLCIRLLHREIKFQVVSAKLGFEWRLCPRRGGSHSIIPRGESNSIAVVIGRKKDGYGRKHFRIRESFLSVVLLNISMEVLEDSTVGRVCITYTVEDRAPQVAIGLREVQFPPKELTQMDLMVAKLARNPHLLEEIKERLRAVVSVIHRELDTKVLPLAASSPGDSLPSAPRVAAMLMLLPRALAGWPAVFRTFLHYHLLAPDGPKFAHMFVFIDEPNMDCDDGGNDDEADEDEGPSSLMKWMAEIDEADELRPLVSVLDGSGPACLEATPGRRTPDLDAKIRAAALGGELVARQLLNMERCLEMAHEHGLDWLFCNLDADEAFLCRGGVGDLFRTVPPEIWQLQVVNHEAVLESRAPPADFFQNCTLFKRNPLLMMEAKGRSEEQKRCMDFWGNRVVAAATETQTLLGEDPANALRPSDGYFSAYFIGKSAVRVGECHTAGLVPAGPHDWPVYDFGTARADPDSACLLHYVNCQGASGLIQKYSARTAERWNKIEFHNLCQRAYAHGSSVLEGLITNSLVLHEADADELEAQLAAGVCMRITKVRDACSMSRS